MKSIDRQEILQGFLLGVFLILLRYREIFSMAVVPQLQIWHFHWPASLKFVGDLPSQMLFVLTSYLTNALLYSSKHTKVWIYVDGIIGVRIPLHSAVLVEWGIHDPSITNEPRCALCVLQYTCKGALSSRPVFLKLCETAGQ
jgi:hypothetical protein